MMSSAHAYTVQLNGFYTNDCAAVVNEVQILNNPANQIYVSASCNDAPAGQPYYYNGQYFNSQFQGTVDVPDYEIGNARSMHFILTNKCDWASNEFRLLSNQQVTISPTCISGNWQANGQSFGSRLETTVTVNY